MSLSGCGPSSTLIKRICLAVLTAELAYDATQYIDAAINEVLKTLSETLVHRGDRHLSVPLDPLRSVLVPLVAIPISLIGGMFLMQVFGFTLNLLTLLAIVLSVGLGGRRRDCHR